MSPSRSERHRSRRTHHSAFDPWSSVGNTGPYIPPVITCPTCGRANPEGAKFCMDCATPLGAAAVAEERKVVSALFCALVAFTASAESAGPEDVDRMLAEYSAMTRSAIESYGG